MASLLDINGTIMSFVEEDVEIRAETKFVVFASAQKFLQNLFFETFPIIIVEVSQKILFTFSRKLLAKI
jgi:hypothetical protein